MSVFSAQSEKLRSLYTQALYESLVLLEYLDDAFPENSLRPADPHEAGLVRLALQHITNVVVPAFYKYVQAQEPEAQEEGGKAFVKALRDLHAQWFLPDSDWARGQDFGLVDIALAPWVVRFDLLEKHRGFSADAVNAQFAAWTRRILDRPSVRATTSLPEDYEKVYRAAPFHSVSLPSFRFT
jgi:glutathione S-transferase